MNSFTNFITKIDNIGPEVKLFNEIKSGNRHQTVCGGIITIIVYLLSLAISVYFAMSLIYRNSPQAYQTTQYKDIVPRIDVKPQSLYFAIKFEPPVKLASEVPEGVLEYYATLKFFKNDSIVSTYEMRKCSFKDDFKYTEGFFDDYKEEIDGKAYCIGNMYQNGQIIKPNDPNYFYPYIQDGMKSLNGAPVYLLVGAMRCQNTTENKNYCASKEKVDSYLFGSLYTLFVLDNNFDSNNYNEPIQKYVTKVNGRATGSTVADNYLNFNNILFRTHDGFLFDEMEELNSFKLSERVEIVSSNDAGGSLNPIIFQMNFCLQNSPVTFERYYVKVQDVLASIGGIIKALLILGQVVNSFFFMFFEKKILMKNVVSKYIRFSDNNEENGKKFLRIDEETKKIKEVQFSDKVHYSQNNQENNKDNQLIYQPEYEKGFPKKELGKLENFNEKIEVNSKGNSPLFPLGSSTLREDRPIFIELSNLKGDGEDERQINQLKMTEMSNNKLKNSKSMMESSKIKFHQFFLIKLKNLIGLNKNNQDLANFKEAEKLKLEIFNEATIYGMFFDLEKMKKIFFNQEQRIAFDHIKVDWSQLIEKWQKKVDLKIILEELLVSGDKTSNILAELLRMDIN